MTCTGRPSAITAHSFCAECHTSLSCKMPLGLTSLLHLLYCACCYLFGLCSPCCGRVQRSVHLLRCTGGFEQRPAERDTLSRAHTAAHSRPRCACLKAAARVPRPTCTRCDVQCCINITGHDGTVVSRGGKGDCPVPVGEREAALGGCEAPEEPQGSGTSASGQPAGAAALADDASRAAVAFKVPPTPARLYGMSRREPARVEWTVSISTTSYSRVYPLA